MKHWRLQLGTSRRNTTPRICSWQLQHRMQQRLFSRFLHHWVPRQFLPRSSQEYGRVELRRTSLHGTRLVYSLSRCSWGSSRLWPPHDWMLHEATSSRLFTPVGLGELFRHRAYGSDGRINPMALRRASAQALGWKRKGESAELIRKQPKFDPKTIWLIIDSLDAIKWTSVWAGHALDNVVQEICIIMRGGETFEAAVQDVMNRTSWLRDYLEDYRFGTTVGKKGVGKGAGRGKNHQMFASNSLPHDHAEEHRDASSHGHRYVPRGDHRPDTRLERTRHRQKSKRSRLALSSRKDVASPKARVPKLWCANVQSVIVLVTAPALVRFARDSTGP